MTKAHGYLQASCEISEEYAKRQASRQHNWMSG